MERMTPRRSCCRRRVSSCSSARRGREEHLGATHFANRAGRVERSPARGRGSRQRRSRRERRRLRGARADRRHAGAAPSDDGDRHARPRSEAAGRVAARAPARCRDRRRRLHDDGRRVPRPRPWAGKVVPERVLSQQVRQLASSTTSSRPRASTCSSNRPRCARRPARARGEHAVGNASGRAAGRAAVRPPDPGVHVAGRREIR